MANDCKKIEQLLWQYSDGDISNEDKAKVELHLIQCADCLKAMETIRLLKGSSRVTEDVANSVDAHVFDSAVMRKIEAQKRPELVPVTPSRQYIIRTALSFAAAATIVFFFVKSISDIGNLRPPREVLKETKFDSTQGYNYFNIELGKNYVGKASKDSHTAQQPTAESQKSVGIAPETKDKALSILNEKIIVSPESTPLAGSPTIKKSMPIESDKIEIKQPGIAIAPSPAPPPTKSEIDVIREAEKTTSAPPPEIALRGGRALDMAAPPIVTGTTSAQTQSSYSILAKPVSQSSPDSINIEGVYLTGDNIPLNVQSSAASISEVISDTGSVQMGIPQSSMLVTIDKMPEVILMVTPEYPVWAKKRGLSGVVWIKAQIDTAGNVTATDIISSSLKGAGFEDASIQAARQSKFHPAEINGNPIEVWIIYPVKFIFKNDSVK